MFNIKTVLGTMKKRVFSPVEKMQILREAEEYGATSTCRKYDVATSLFYNGLQGQYYRVDLAVRELEKENECLKKIIARQAFNI